MSLAAPHNPTAPGPARAGGAAAAVQLKRLLRTAGIRQAHLARELGISPGTLADLLNHGKWPRAHAAQIASHVRQRLVQAGVTAALCDAALRDAPATAPTDTPTPPAAQPQDAAARRMKDEPGKETDMLMQKQTLAAATRRHFGLARDPFINDVTQAADVFASADIRMVREALWQHVRHGGLMALVGESGSGKTTLVADLKDRLLREGRDVCVIEPSVLCMEENDARGKTLKSAAIMQAIVATVAPQVAPRRDAEARARQVRELLTAGHRAGQRYLLLIEEAHCLPTATLKHLKRFAEIKDGLTPLLGIVLVGQPELRQRLAVHNAEVREVAQRCDLLELPPLDGCLGEYLKFKFARVGVDVDRVISAQGVAALRERLSFARRTGQGRTGQLGMTYISLAHPLAVANALTAAMNVAASLGAPLVDADIVREV